MAKKRKAVVQNNNNLAICYYRYSSHSQNDASIEQQQRAAQEYAEKNGYRIVAEYSDRAKTGTNANRPGLQKMLSEVEYIRPAVLIVWKVDRLGRNRDDVFDAKRIIRGAGCSIHYIAEPLPNDGAGGTLLEAIYEAMAENYSSALSENVTRGMNDNARKAYTNGHKVLGYRRGEDKHYEIDPDTAPLVLRIYTQYADGRSMQSICDELNTEGYKTVRGGQFTINSLRTILSNRNYLGEYRYDTVIIPGGMPAIVTQELFDQVQSMFARNKRKGPGAKALDGDAPRYWLTGKLFCGHCGSAMQGVHGTSRNGGKYYYYSCPCQRKRQGCHLKPVRKDLIEARVGEVLNDYLNNPTELGRLVDKIMEDNRRRQDNSDYISQLEARLKELTTALDNVLDFIVKGIHSEAVAEKLQQIEQEKAVVEQRLSYEKAVAQARTTGDMFKAKVAYYIRGFADLGFPDGEARKEVLDFYIDKVIVRDDKLVITCWYSEDKQEISLNDVFEGINAEIFAPQTFECSAPWPTTQQR